MRTPDQIVNDLKKAMEEEKKASERCSALKKELTEVQNFVNKMMELHIGPVA